MLLPGQELLAKATTAAQLGHFLPPSEESKQDSDRSYAKGLLSLLRSGVAAMLQHRQLDGFRLLGLRPARPGWESRRCWSPPPSPRELDTELERLLQEHAQERSAGVYRIPNLRMATASAHGFHRTWSSRPSMACTQSSPRGFSDFPARTRAHGSVCFAGGGSQLSSSFRGRGPHP